MSARDYTVLEAMRDALVALGEFAVVPLSTELADVRTTGDQNPVVHLQRKDWDEDTKVGGSIQFDRTVRYEATILYREQDPDIKFRNMTRYESLVCNALGGQSFAGITVRDRTRIRRGRDDRTRHPESRLILQGEFVYFITGHQGRDTAK